MLAEPSVYAPRPVGGDDPVMSGYSRLAMLECATCSAILEVFPHSADPGIAWEVLDADLCKAPPLNRCPHARAEIKRRFPEFNI